MTAPSSLAEKKRQAHGYLQQNRLVEAQKLFSELCAAEERNPDNHCAMGLVCARQDKFAEAEQCFLKALALAPQSSLLYYYLGGALISQRRFSEAAAALREAVTREPAMVQAHVSLGDVLAALDDFSQARTCYEQAVRLNPRLAVAHYGLGRTLHALGGVQEAITSLREAIRLQPQLADAHCELARILLVLGQIDDAEQHFLKALELSPTHLTATVGLAAARERANDVDGAWRMIKPYIHNGAKHGAIGQVFAKICRPLGRSAEAAAYLEEAIKQEQVVSKEKQLSQTELAQLYYALGKLYDNLDRYDSAFANFAEGNTLRARVYSQGYDPRDFEQFAEETEKVFTHSAIVSMPRAGVESDRPVFIVGMPRSGTTLVEQILASHPQVYGAGELPYIDQMAKTLPLGPYPQGIRGLSAETLNILARRYLSQIDALSSDTIRVTDKLPHNFLYLGFIALLFPQARVIHCQRDPLDTCLSIYFQDFTASHLYAHDLRHLGHYYRWYERLMRHWRAVLTIPILDVRYEELVGAPETGARRLIEFLGLKWDERCLEFHKLKRAVGTASYDQVREPIYKRSVARWKNYEKHLGPLRQALDM